MRKTKVGEVTFKVIKGYRTSFSNYDVPALQVVPFRREFEEEITLYAGDSVEYDDVMGLLTVTHEDDSHDTYPYTIVYPNDKEKK